jgi:hypothetical protein
LASLSKTYEHFNTRIYTTFFSSESAGNFVGVHVDDDFIAAVASELTLSVEGFLEIVARDVQSDWSIHIHRRLVEKPMYLGLIAMQMYAAYLMDKNDEYGEAAYNPRLCQLLRIEEHQLQQLYREYQDPLWKGFGTWCGTNGFIVQLPLMRRGPGRYTQYPLTQALLNRKDLKRLPYVFDYVGLRCAESLFFTDFMDLLRHADKHPRVTTHYLKVKKRVLYSGMEIPFYQQIFAYYHSWDGLLPEFEEVDSDQYPSSNHQGGNFQLTTDNACSEIIIRDDQDTAVNAQSLDDPMALTKLQRTYRVLQNGMLFFTASTDYEDLWENQRYLERDRHCQIIAPKSKQVAKMLGPNENILLYSNNYFDVARFYYSDNLVLDEAFDNCFFRRPQVRLKGGLKLSRRQWLYGAGPLLYFLQAGDYYLNGQKLSFQAEEVYSCAESVPGRYALKHKDHSPVVFYIEEAREQSGVTLPVTGWQINAQTNTWAPGKTDFTLSGLLFIVISDGTVSTPFREWITANTDPKNQPHTILTINILNRARYGIPR